MSPLLAWVLAAGLLGLSFWLWRGWRQDRAELVRLRAADHETLRGAQAAHEQALAERQTLFNSMAEGVMLLDNRGRVQLVNRSLERLFHLGIDIRGLTLMESIRLPELAELVEQVVQEHKVLTREIELTGQDNRLLEVSAAAVLDREVRPQGTILVFHDLTRVRQLENTRREFVANVSHELRTPLSLIKGYVETLLDGAKSDPELTSRFLQIIERHTNRLASLIEDLLTISRLESGRITLNLAPVKLRPLAGRVLEELTAKADTKKVTFENRVPEGLAAWVDGDRLHQVLTNLLDNAIKYGRTEGHVVMKGQALGNGEVEVCVCDDGPGIPPEARSRIFERFYRVDKARSRESGGTGLGLAIVKHIVQSHGGEVRVESTLGQGCSFFFTLRERAPVSPSA